MIQEEILKRQEQLLKDIDVLAIKKCLKNESDKCGRTKGNMSSVF
ncbi:MAG: hypothetical protein ACERKV_02995 [Clostridiaceae bacterium]